MTSIVYPTTNLRHVEQLNIVRGEGVYVYDDSGKEYLEDSLDFGARLLDMET